MAIRTRRAVLRSVWCRTFIYLLSCCSSCRSVQYSRCDLCSLLLLLAWIPFCFCCLK